MSSRVLASSLEPFQPFLDVPGTTDIVVNRPGEIGVETNGVWHWHDEPFLTYDRLEAIAILTAFHTGQDIDDVHPLCATTLPGGERVQVCRPPVTAPGTISLSIRRPPSFRPTLSHLAETGLFDALVTTLSDLKTICGGDADMLQSAVVNKKNIVICGPTSSGKTTLAKALIEAIPLNERIITIEDTPEWNTVPHRNRVALYYSKGGQSAAQVTSEDLIEASLRMRPDRVLMQELRDGATFAYLRGVVAGHPGCITTLHAGSAKGAFDALRLMMRQHSAGAALADGDIRMLLEEQIDISIQCERRDNVFRIADIWLKS